MLDNPLFVSSCLMTRLSFSFFLFMTLIMIILGNGDTSKKIQDK